MRKGKVIFSIFLVLAIVLAMTACSAGNKQTSSGTNNSAEKEVNDTSNTKNDDAAANKEDKKIVFGISMPQLDNDGFKANLIGIQQAAEKLGVEIITADAKNSADTQMQQIEDFITKGVDAIVMCPIDSSALAAAVKKANDANIPVAAFDRNVADGVLVGLAESDNRKHGERAAELMAAAAEKNGLTVADLKVLELQGALSTSSGLERHEGFSQKAKELGINIVVSLPTEYKMDMAYSAVLDAFQAHPDINAIFIPSDNACYSGVESALRQLNKLIPVGEEGHIILTSVDGGPQGLEGVRNNYIDGIAAQSKLLMSEEAMRLAYNAVIGQKNDETIIRIPPTDVTKENVDDETLWANAIKKFKN